MKPRIVAIAVTFSLGLLGGLALGPTLQAQPQGITREMLQRADLPELPGWLAALGRATVPPGVAAGRHTHPGPEFGIVVEGTAVLEVEGRAPVTLKAGDSYHIPAGVPHDARNTGAGPAVALAFWVVQKDKPFAQPVK